MRFATFGYQLVRVGELRKTAVGLTPFVRFFSATFGAGIVATQRPITRPKRQLQLERHAKYRLKLF
jgi:hypothetical protein